MSSHILNQFEESWLNEITETGGRSTGGRNSGVSNLVRQQRRFSFLTDPLRGRELLIVLIAALAVICALEFVARANERIDLLEQKIKTLECSPTVSMCVHRR